MAENDGDKTEPATQRRRQEAWDSGHVAKSHDLTAAAGLLAGLAVVYLLGQTIVTQFSIMMRALLGNNFASDPKELVSGSMRLAARPMIAILGPIFGTVVVVALVVSVAQVGLRFTSKPLVPNLAKLNPMAGFGRLFSGQNWFQLAMNVTKMVTVGAIAYQRVWKALPTIISLPGLDFPQNMAVGFGVVFDLGLRIAVALVILALLDWIYHKWKFERDIRMSKQEIKDEMKMMEGDMALKGRRRQMARKMILQRIHADVPRADVVVTNPTELAIALKYDSETMGAPRVVAKGAGFLAMRIRQVAASSGVPIVERKPLAQALYKGVEVGQEVPPEFYQTVAEILAYVYELSGKAARRRAG